MHQLVYGSSATQLFTKEELLALLEHSRVNNTRNDVTGLLLYKDGNIMQVLEGEAAIILPLFKKISADRRHTGVMRLLAGEIPARNFPDWSMGFRDLQSPETTRLPGYSEFMNLPLNEITDGAQSLRLLSIFRGTR